jgi:hypothetical protein
MSAMISTQNRQALPDQKSLQRICKAISVLDAIISSDWESRYYSYNSKWGKNEEFFEMRNGEGDHMLILFQKDACVMNGYAVDARQHTKAKVTENLPDIFQEFIFGEPVKTIGTTFCLWKIKDQAWQIGNAKPGDDHSEELLAIFDDQPQTYIDWASDYFDGSYSASGITLTTVKKIYEGKTLTKKMVLTIVDEPEDWEQLEADLQEIGYPYDFT